MAEPETYQALIEAARQARLHAYAPYSGFRVGAAALSDDGRIFSGANVENASYGLTICAERTAIAQAVSAGARAIAAVAVVTGTSPPAAPCGMCRQTMAEFAADCDLLLFNDRGERMQVRLSELLPLAFRPSALEQERDG